MEHHIECGAGRQRQACRGRLAQIHRQPVLALHLDHARRVPAAVARRHPLGQILRYLLVLVQHRVRQRQVQHIAGERPPRRPVGRAQAALMRLAAGDDMIDIDLCHARERLARVRAVDASAHRRHDLRFHALGIIVVVGVVGDTTVLVCDRNARQRVGMRRLFQRRDPCIQLKYRRRQTAYQRRHRFEVGYDCFQADLFILGLQPRHCERGQQQEDRCNAGSSAFHVVVPPWWYQTNG